ncbi:MAG: hypothetical protein LBU51_08415 [Bacteroidales bacterium]|nr:hypothetical protein [Bacteroidales bacterium]
MPSYIKDYQIYLHNSSKHKYFIVYEGDVPNDVRNAFLSVVLLYDGATGERLWNNEIQPLLTITNANEQFLSISSLNNVLILCTNQRKLFLIWLDTEQTYLPVRQDDFYVGTMNIITDLATETILHYPDNNTDSGLIRQSIVTNPYRYYNRKITGQTDIRTYLDRFFSQLDDLLHNKGYYRGFSLFVFAVRLYDDSYVYMSDVSFCDINGDYDNSYNIYRCHLEMSRKIFTYFYL